VSVCNTGSSRWSAVHRYSWRNSSTFIVECASTCSREHVVSTRRCPSPFCTSSSAIGLTTTVWTGRLGVEVRSPGLHVLPIWFRYICICIDSWRKKFIHLENLLLLCTSIVQYIQCATKTPPHEQKSSTAKITLKWRLKNNTKGRICFLFFFHC
jgi:hypothetical protein